MAKTRLNPDELQTMIMSELRKSAPCASLQNVTIVQSNEANGANWRIDGYVVDGSHVLPFDCKRTAIALQVAMQQEFDAIWPG